MNVFIAGGHGVGKTFLVSALTLPAGVVATSASKLIREERGQASWGMDKRVAEVDANQLALASAVKRHNDGGARLLLDGHFALHGADGALRLLDAEVFAALNLSGVILLEAKPDVVAERIQARDNRKADREEIESLASAERNQAYAVCAQLGLTLVTMQSPRVDEFAAFVDALTRPRPTAA